MHPGSRLATLAIATTVLLPMRGVVQTHGADITPELWGEGLISTPLDELNTVFSPDGKELYWSIEMPDQSGMIVFSRQTNGKWSEPEVASFSGHFTDWDPFFSADGQKIVFTSNRPKGGTEPRNPQDYDLWMVTRLPGGGWSEPANLGAPVNTTRPEYYPSIATDGTLYFSSNRDGGQGSFDVYRSRFLDGKYTEPENLGVEVNGKSAEIDNYVAPDQSYVIFASYGRPDNLGSGDLYISLNRDGKWTPAVHLPAGINSPALEYCPIGSPDGKWLYFTSNRWSFGGTPAATLKLADLRKAVTSTLNGRGNIYRVPMSEVLAAARR